MSKSALSIPTTTASSNSPNPTAERARVLSVFHLCAEKTRRNIETLADAPKSWSNAVDGDYEKYPEGFYEIGNWTSSFFTGMALLAWRETEDEFFLKQVLRLAPHYREKAVRRFLDMHHDAGFLYSLYSVALFKLTADREHREVGIAAATALAQRFNEKGNFIRAWGRMDTDEFADMAIIDCLMNLPLLHWAAEETGNLQFREIAIKHADMALKVFLRADGSVYHAYRFDLATGEPLRGDTFGGCAAESHWARGAAWAIYGFALSYGYTRDEKCLAAAVKVAHAFVANLDAEMVPLWDFKLTPGFPEIRDASAAAVAVCGIQEILKSRPQETRLKSVAQQMLQRLCSNDYVDFDPLRRGVLKQCMIGAPGKSGRSAYTSWGDYYLMEAVSRELGHGDSWW
jgi:unsaturated chondroitin disaccharide hydrolase